MSNIYKVLDKEGKTLGYKETYNINSNEVFTELSTSYHFNTLSKEKVIVKTTEINDIVKIVDECQKVFVELKPMSPMEIHQLKLERILASGKVEFSPSIHEVVKILTKAKDEELDKIISKIENLSFEEDTILLSIEREQ